MAAIQDLGGNAVGFRLEFSGFELSFVALCGWIQCHADILLFYLLLEVKRSFSRLGGMLKGNHSTGERKFELQDKTRPVGIQNL